jgi:hypothetical protein
MDLLKQKGLLGDGQNQAASMQPNDFKNVLQKLQTFAQQNGVGGLKSFLGQNPNLVNALSSMKTA